MCGIAGFLKTNSKVDEKSIFQMQHALKRRGPDQDGLYLGNGAALAHTRLSVIDLENGRQPMIYRRGEEKYIIVYNGELYNTEEVRNRLKNIGYTFESHSDTEVLLKSYAEHKEKCLDYLNGIFSFAIFEERSNRLFLARDRIGVKPFFYHLKNGAFYFASEIKSLLSHPDIKAKLDEKSISEIMLMGPGRTPGCGVFSGIEELIGGHYAIFANGELKIKKYWELKHVHHSDNFEQTSEKVQYLVLDATKRQLVSDVPIGTFLSGGLDSSIITSVAKQELGSLMTFSVDYEENDKFFQSSVFTPENDMTYIQKMRDFLGDGITHHRVILKTEDLVNSLYEAVDARDLPGMGDIDSSLLLFSKEVKKYATCSLSGECADEIFGGYPWFRDEQVRNLDTFPWSVLKRDEFLHDDLKEVIDKDYSKKRYEEALKQVSVLKNSSPLEKRMKEMSRLNFDYFMQTLLDRKDRMSMYSGVEVRVPFCDYRIAEYLYSVPWEFKDYLGREKGLLRHAMKNYLPHDVLYRKKSPYPKTHNPKFLSLVSAELKKVLDNASSPLLKIANKKSLENLLVTNNPVPWYGQLMTTPQTIAYFLQVNYWLKKFF
ncbi:MAG: asparagine synthase (glutamine-hydrolyzing) [Firmicutes bacterium]|nr:asparagine synthase (glutamine-hydrolyzing) [Bacillota bacterium]